MRIDWEHETFEGGLETWHTEFRGMDVVIRRAPGAEMETTITAGCLQSPLYSSIEEILPGDAMVAALKYINGYWDMLEEGPVQYETMPDLTPKLTQQPDADERDC